MPERVWAVPESTIVPVYKMAMHAGIAVVVLVVVVSTSMIGQLSNV